MNIFLLDSDPYEAARQNCDRHCVKIILECFQMLSVALIENGVAGVPYKKTHAGHPMSRWVRETRNNYRWTCDHVDGLLSEYTSRYGKIHACQKYLNYFRMHDQCIPDGPMTQFPLCMPDEYKVPGDPVTSYRNYYKGAKAYFAKWKLGNEPIWW